LAAGPQKAIRAAMGRLVEMLLATGVMACVVNLILRAAMYFINRKSSYMTKENVEN
jgi:hypothetical protein